MYEMNFPFVPLRMVKDGEVGCMYEGFEFWKGIAQAMAKVAENVHEECFIVCALNAKKYPLCIYIVEGGIQNIHISDLFRIAVLYGISDVLIAHKYPKKASLRTADFRFFLDTADLSPMIGMQINDYIVIEGKEILFSVKQNPDVLEQWIDSEAFLLF